MSRYANLTNLKLYLGLDSGTIDDALLQQSLDRAEAEIDAHTRRSFVGTAGTVYASRFEADRVQHSAFYLRQDLHTLTSLTLGNGQVVPIGSVWLEPREGPPYRIIRLHSAYVYTWNTDQDMIMAGTWGYGTIAPDDIQHATIRLAAQLYRQKDQSVTDTVGNDTLGVQSMPRGLPRDVYDILQKYRSRSGGAV